MDIITYYEESFAVKLAVCDTFLDCATKYCELIPNLENLTARALVDRREQLGITYHVQTADDNVARALQHVHPYLQSGEVCEALKLLEGVSVQLNNQTIVSR